MKDTKVVPIQGRISATRFSIKAFDALNTASALCNALNGGESADSPNVKNLTVTLTDRLAALPMKQFYEQFGKK